MKRINQMVDIIRKNGSIRKIQLIISSRVSISYYEKLKPMMEELFEDIWYEKNTQTWHAIETEEIENK